MRKFSVGFWILVIAVTGVVLSSGLTSYMALNKFEAVFAPELENKAQTVGESVKSLMTKLMNYGVPFDRLRGLDEEFAKILEDNPEISFLKVRDQSGEVLYSQASKSNRSSQIAGTEADKGKDKETLVPVVLDGKRLGTLYVGQNGALMATKLREILNDILTVVIVAILMSIELLIFLTTFTITSPMQSLRALMQRTRDGDLTCCRTIGKGDEIDRFSYQVNQLLEEVNTSYQSLAVKCQTACGSVLQSGQRCVTDCIEKLKGDFLFREGAARDVSEQKLIFVRPPLFLLIFSESMSLSFFPLYVESFYQPIAGISKDYIIGLPISLFMLVWAFSLPSAGQWSDRVGRRKAFMLGAGITAIGLVLTGLSGNMLQLLVCRCLTAIGYGLVFITAQGFVTDNTTTENRTKGMAIFLSGFFSGALCGAAIGGILAARIGYQHTFLLSAGLSVASALFVYQFLKERPKEEEVQVRKMRLADFKILLINPRFLTITFLTAIPAKVCLTGFLYYTGPLYLQFLGNDSSASGRILMAYGLAIIIISPATAYLADKLGKRQYFVVLGGLLSGFSLLAAYFEQSLFGILAAVCLLGLGHAIGVSPQLSLISSLPQKPGKELPLGATIGIFRLTERLGNVGGPIIAATGITLVGFSGMFLIFGIYMVSSTLLFAVMMAYFERSDRKNSLGVAEGVQV